MISAMIAGGFGLSCPMALTVIWVAAQCLSFVDDTDIVEAASSVDDSGASILPSIQASLSLWSGLVRATGGTINPEKSF